MDRRARYARMPRRRAVASRIFRLVFVVLTNRGQRQAMSVVLRLSLRLVALSQVVRQVVLNVVGEFLLILRIQPQDIDQTANVDTFQVTIG